MSFNVEKFATLQQFNDHVQARLEGGASTQKAEEIGKLIAENLNLFTGQNDSDIAQAKNVYRNLLKLRKRCGESDSLDQKMDQIAKAVLCHMPAASFLFDQNEGLPTDVSNRILEILTADGTSFQNSKFLLQSFAQTNPPLYRKALAHLINRHKTPLLQAVTDLNLTLPNLQYANLLGFNGTDSPDEKKAFNQALCAFAAHHQQITHLAVRGIRELPPLPNLETLHLRGCSVENWPYDSSRIKAVGLTACPQFNKVLLDEMRNLEILDIDRTSVDTLPDNLPHLKKLRVSTSALKQIPASYTHLTHLNIKFSLIDQLPDLPNLEVLCCGYEQLKPEERSKLPSTCKVEYV